MEPDQPRTGGFVPKMAEHRVAHFGLQSLEVVCLREDGCAQRASRKPAFWGFFAYEDDLVRVRTSEVGGPATSLDS
jgi:hypothetical protein